MHFDEALPDGEEWREPPPLKIDEKREAGFELPGSQTEVPSRKSSCHPVINSL